MKMWNQVRKFLLIVTVTLYINFTNGLKWITEPLLVNKCNGQIVNLTWEYIEDPGEKVIQHQWIFNRNELIAYFSLDVGFNVEPKYEGRVNQSGKTGILLHNISYKDSGSYTFYPLIKWKEKPNIQTVQLNVIGLDWEYIEEPGEEIKQRFTINIEEGIAESRVINLWIGETANLTWEEYTEEIVEEITQLQWIFNRTELIAYFSLNQGFNVEPKYQGRVNQSGKTGILLHNISSKDSGTYTFWAWRYSKTVQLNVISRKVLEFFLGPETAFEFVKMSREIAEDVYYENSVVSYTCVNRTARLFPDDGDITHAMLIFNRIMLIALISLDALIVEPKYQGRVSQSGKTGILLHNISAKDSGTYSLYPLIKWAEKPNVQTVQLNVIENTVDPDCSCTKLSVIPKERSGQTYRIVAGTCTLEINSSFCCPVGLVYQYCVNDPSKLCVPIRNPNHVTESNTQYKTVNQEGDTNGDKEFITILICVLVIVIMVFCVIGVFKIHDWKNKNLKNNGETLDSRYAEESHSLNKQDKMSVITGIYEN